MFIKWLRAFLFGAAIAFAAAAHAAVPLAGDNESGLEFPSSLSQCQWFSPDPTFALTNGHAKIIRVPYTALCAVPQAGGAINSAYMVLLKKTLVIAFDAGVPVVLDLHQYGYINGVDITTAEGEAYFLNVHHQVVEWLKDNLTTAQFNMLIIGLMNEPHSQSDVVYKPVFQAAINELRADGFTGYITYPGTGYSGEHNLSANSTFMQGVTDPLSTYRVLAEVHQYYDPDYSGTHDVPIASASLGRVTMAGAEAWSARTGIYLILDETGDPQPIVNHTLPASFPAGAWTTSDQYFRGFMNEAVASGRYFAIIPWGGGRYWGAYMFSDYPSDGFFTATGVTYGELSVGLGQ